MKLRSTIYEFPATDFEFKVVF